RLCVKPVGELVRVMAAAGLTTLSAGNEQDGIVPIGGVRNESHCRAMTLGRSAWAEPSSSLRLVRETQEKFEWGLSADGMLHFERIEILPLPVPNLRIPSDGLQRLPHGIRRCDDKFIEAFVRGRQPLRRTVRQKFLKDCHFAPAIEVGILSEIRFEN